MIVNPIPPLSAAAARILAIAGLAPLARQQGAAEVLGQIAVSGSPETADDPKAARIRPAGAEPRPSAPGTPQSPSAPPAARLPPAMPSLALPAPLARAAGEA